MVFFDFPLCFLDLDQIFIDFYRFSLGFSTFPLISCSGRLGEVQGVLWVPGTANCWCPRVSRGGVLGPPGPSRERPGGAKA